MSGEEEGKQRGNVGVNSDLNVAEICLSSPSYARLKKQQQQKTERTASG